jgi:hypothetical protein
LFLRVSWQSPLESRAAAAAVDIHMIFQVLIPDVRLTL